MDDYENTAARLASMGIGTYFKQRYHNTVNRKGEIVRDTRGLRRLLNDPYHYRLRKGDYHG